MTMSPAEHAEELRLFSLYARIDDWMEEAREEIRLDTAEGAVAEIIFDRLFGLMRELDPAIERLAVRQAQREAEREAEEAEDDRRYAELEAPQ